MSPSIAAPSIGIKTHTKKWHQQMALILLCEEDIDPTGSDVRCQIIHLTKTETEPQISNPSLGFTLAEPQTGIIVKSWFGVLSQSFPSSGWRKQSFWEGKRQKFELKLFLLGHDLYKRYILQKTGSKTAICVLRTGLNNLHPLMWGSHGQLDDWPTKTQMTIGDHLVGWATRETLVRKNSTARTLFSMESFNKT